MNELSPQEEYRTEVVVNVEAQEAVKGALRVSYRVQEAGWTPFYDARLTIGDGKAKPALELVNRADVTQSTGESWNNVALTLSTARPNGTTSAPDVLPWEVSKLEPAEPAPPVAAAPMAEAEGFLEDDAATDGRTKSRQLVLGQA